MARETKPRRKPKNVIDAGIKAALKLGATKPWAGITLAEIAETAGLSLSDYFGKADKASLSEAIEPWLDKAMSAERIDMEESPRERLFDVIMLRFEAMEPYRAGLLSLMEWRQNSPARAASLFAARKHTAEWALTSAGLDSSAEIPFPVKALNIAWVISRTTRAWRKEEDADFARTMAMLDAELRGCDERLSWIDRVRGWPGRPRDRSAETEARKD